MAINNENELLVFLLSGLRQNAQSATRIFQEIAKAAQDSDVKKVFLGRLVQSRRSQQI